MAYDAAQADIPVSYPLLVAIVGFRATSNRALRTFFVAHPLVMAVTATGNHYFVDSIAGAAAALAAVPALALWRRNRSRSTGPRRFIRSPQVVPALSTGT